MTGLIKKAAGVESGSSNPKTTKVGKISRAALKKIAEYKLPDLNAYDIDNAMKIIEGSARNMGITIEEDKK